MNLQETIDKQVFGKVIAETLVAIQQQFESNQLSEGIYKRWINTIGKASAEFENNPCWKCTEIFIAEPRNRRYCSDTCKNSVRNKRHYNKQKRLKSDLPANEESFYE